MDLATTPPVNQKAQKISGETQLRKFGTFLEEHVKLMDKLNAADNDHNYYRQTAKPDAIQCAPVTIDFDMRHESLSLFQLVNTNNKVLNKIVCVFTHLCIEAKQLRDLAEQYQLQFLYIDATVFADPSKDQHQLIVCMSEQLEFLCNIQYLVQRTLFVCIDIFKQLGAFFADSRYILNNNTNTSIQLQSVFGYLADLATIFVTFDQILNKSHLRENWPMFMKSINSLYDNLEQFSTEYNESDIGGLRNVLNELELLYKGDLFQMLIDALYGVKLQFDNKSTTALGYHYVAYIKTQFFKIDKYPTVLNDFNESKEIIKINVMCILNHTVFTKLEQSLFTRLFEINSKYCGIALVEHILWCPELFVNQYVLHTTKSNASKAQAKYVTDAVKFRQEHLRSKFSDYRITCITQKICLRIFVWTLKVRETQQQREQVEVNVDSLHYRCSLILDGIQLMGEISYLVKLVTNLHINLNCLMSKATLANVCRLLEHFQIIKMVYNEYLDFFIDSVFIVCQHMSYQALSIIQMTMKKFTGRTASTSYNERDIDIMSALQLSEKCMFGPATAVRILITRLTLSISDPTKIFSIDHMDKLSKVLSNMEALIDLRTTINKCPDNTFLYWHKAILPNYLKQVLNPSADSAKVWNIYHSPKSSVQFLSKINSSTLTASEINEATNFSIDVNHLLRSSVLSKLCSHIENNLRLFIHSYMHNTSVGAIGSSAVVNDTSALIHLNPLQLQDCHFLFKNHIEHYLSKTFYNLTSVSLSDGRTYSEMRSFARIKYDLNMVEDQLPTETLEQGLDLLDIMRLINEFVTKFVYDMNNQVFIQAMSSNNFLNTVTVGHIVNSLRTHGIGIMNTAINCGYKLLCQKMPLISKFLYTDKVKSGLSKNLKHFQDNKERLNQMYSYELAKSFTKNMDKLSSELSFIDFLSLITQIGNIMGYVRLIRSAGIKYVSNAAIFLPSLNNAADNFSLADQATKLNLSDVTCEAAWNLNINIINLSKDFVIKPDYFRSFLQAFTEIIRDPKNIHLKYFFISVPSLTQLFVDAIVRSKENKHKNAGVKDRHAFTDDGFAMGLAYILIILNQVEMFTALDWFESVRTKYESELDGINEKLKSLTSNYEDEKLRQTLLLTVKRINTFKDEFEMLRCNFRSAIRYFQ